MKNLFLTFIMMSTSLLSQTMHTINAGNYYYSPEALTIEQGDSVEFINDSGFHDVVITSGPEMLTLPACSGPCDIGVLVFNTPGEYEYICSIGSHSSLGMVGTITVNETDEIFQPQTKEALQAAVDLWVDDNATALATYGEINSWDVSLITDMSNLFSEKSNFNDDISNWDVSNVSDMNGMFFEASSFSGDLSSWDVSNVTSMSNLFMRANQFSADLSTWDVSQVVAMSQMFRDAPNFNADISNWDVSSATEIWSMFRFALSFNQDLSSWNISNVTDMTGIFEGTSLSDENKCAIHTSWSTNSAWTYDWSGFCLTTEIFQPQTKQELQSAVDLWVDDNATALATYGEINTWDVSLITDMSSLFFQKATFNEAIGAWDVSNVINMNGIFREASSFNQDISNWDVSNVTDMGWMFRHAAAFSSDVSNLSNWDVSNVTNMTYMFDAARNFTGDISNWDVSSVTDMSHMFRDHQYWNSDITSWNVSSVTNMAHMFNTHYNGRLNQDLSNWDVSNVTSFNSMFRRQDQLSNENKCAIHTSWSANSNWSYGWNEFCAPTISVAPTSINDALFSGETSTHTLTITNSGVDTLIWSTSELETDPETFSLGGDIEAVIESINSRVSVDFDMAPVAADGSIPVNRSNNSQVANIYHSQRDGGQLNGLILYSDAEGTMIRTKDSLLATGMFNTISAIDIRNYLPTLEEISAFETILIWSNYSFSQAGALGNVLADYVDNGGGLVASMFSMAGGYNISGRFYTEGYFLMTVGGYGITTNTVTILENEHPIFNGVEGLYNPGGSYSLTNTTLLEGATLLASYDSGRPLAVTMDFNGTPRVDLAVYPNLSYEQNRGATAQLLANSMAWVAGHFIPDWVLLDTEMGTVDPGESQDISVTLDATELSGGDYQTNLKLFSNDPTNPELTVPVSLDVTEVYDVTFKLDLRYQDISENGVHLAGNFSDFNGDDVVDNDYPQWDPAGIDMLDEDGDGIYEVTLTLETATYEYKYVNGDTWDLGEISVDSECSFGEDGNRQVVVQTDLVLDPVCFTSCIPCQSITDEPSFSYLGSFGDNLYYLSENVSTWEDANTYLNDNFLDAQLAVVTTAEENAFLASAVTSEAWMGLTDKDSEGVWTWVTGEEYSFENWAPGEPNGSGNYVVFSWSQPGLWDDQPNSYTKPYIVEVTTYENIPPSEFSLLAPADNSIFALTDDSDLLFDLRWQTSQDQDNDVNYFVSLHGAAQVGEEAVSWTASMSELTNQNDPMVNVRFDDNPDIWNQGWSSWPDNFQNMGSVTGDNGNQGASVSQSNDETHPDNYLMQVISADEFDSGVYHLSAMLSSPLANFIGDTEDQAYVYVKTFAQTGGQEILSEVYGGSDVIVNPGEYYKTELFFEVPTEAVEVHIGLAYISISTDGALVHVDDFQLTAPFGQTQMALGKSFFENQFSKLAVLPNLVESIDYSWTVVASDGTFDGWVPASNTLHFSIDNQRTGATRDYHVSVQGADLTGDGTADNPLRNIQTAINVSGSGSHVKVAPGTYEENLVWDSKSLRVEGMAGPEQTIVDGGLNDNTIRLLNLANTDTLMGFTITNGKAIPENDHPYRHGDGVLISGSQVGLKNVVVKNNDGVGVYVHGASPTLENVTIRSNALRGIEFHAAAATGTLKDTRILEHENGPGIYIYDTGINLDECFIANNIGGGIQFVGVAFSPTVVTKTVFAENGSPTTAYGAINLNVSGGNLQISNSVFHHNLSQETGADIRSSGNYFNEDYQGNDITISNSVFSSIDENSSSNIFMADVRDISSSLSLNRTTFSNSSLIITGAMNTVQVDLVYYDLLPLFCDPSNYQEGGFQLAENSMLLDVFVDGELPGVDPTVGCDDVVLPSIFVTVPVDTLHVVEDGTVSFAVHLDPFLDNNHELSVDARDISSEVQLVETDENNMMVWNVELSPNPNLNGDFDVTLLAFNTVYEFTTDYSFVLHVESVNDEPVIESFSDGLAIEFDEDTIYETTLQVSDLDNLNDVTLHASVQSPDGQEMSGPDPFEGDENYTFLGEFSGNKYYKSNYNSAWNDANNLLSELGGAHLVTITSQEENDFLASVAGSSVWIGLNDYEQSRVWNWVTGEEVVYTNWAANEPNNTNERVVEFRSDGKWNDLSANVRLPFIVEVGGGPISVSLEDNLLTLTPSNNWYGDFLLNVVAEDSEGAVDEITVPGHVHPVNDAPTLPALANQITNEDETLNIALHPEDVDGDLLEVSAYLDSDAPVQLFVHSDGDSLLIVPGQDWFGDAVVTVTAHDGEYTAEGSFNLQVLPVDDEPVVTGYLDDVYVYEDFEEYWEVNLNDIFLDIDGPLEFSAELSDAVIGFEINEGMMHLFPLEDANGVAEMVITASNPVRASVSDTVLVTVFAVNDPPVVGSIETIYVTEDVPLEMWTMANLHEQGIISDVDNTLEELEFALHHDHSLFHIEWSHNAQDAPMLYPHENLHGTTMATLCIYDGDYEACSDFEVLVESVNDAPFFAMDMHQVVGLDLDFHMEIHYGDVDTDYEELELTLLSGPAWTHSLDGNHLFGMPTDLGYYPIALQLDDGMDAMVDTLHLHVEHFKPVITSVEDVPNDQGGRVYVSFNASYFDNGEPSGQSYSLFRWDDFDNDSSGWVALSSVGAIGEPAYTFEATTLMDSTSEESNGWTNFKIVASMEGGIFDDHEEGYSVDNIAPGVPNGLMAMVLEDGIELTWSPSLDEDFQYFLLEKSTNESFSSPTAYELVDTTFMDVEYEMNQTYYYRVTAFDHAGNQSDFSDMVEAALLSAMEDLVPAEFALHQNYPNPFNPTTQIKFDLAEDALVSIKIYDVMGRQLKTLVNSIKTAGYHSIQWDATNDLGEGVSAGMYIYMIQAGDLVSTKKMVLLK